MQTMKFEWCPKGGMIEGVNAFLNPYLYLIKDKSPKWETRKIQYGLRVILVTIRAFEVDYVKEEIEKVKFPWYAYRSAKYEVKDNPYGIKEIWYIKNKGWFVVGDTLELWRVLQ